MKRIHINQHVLRYNRKNGADLPVCTVKEGGVNQYASEVYIDGPSHLVNSPGKPLSCGATVWIETEADLRLVGETTYSTIRTVMEAAGIASERDFA